MVAIVTDKVKKEMETNTPDRIEETITALITGKDDYVPIAAKIMVIDAIGATLVNGSTAAIIHFYSTWGIGLGNVILEFLPRFEEALDRHTDQVNETLLKWGKECCAYIEKHKK